MSAIQTLVLGVSGASGVQYAQALLPQLLAANTSVHMVFSKAGRMIANMETSWQLPARAAEIAEYLCDLYQVESDRLQVFAQEDWLAPMASGSGDVDAMVVCPCSMGMLSAVATGASNSLMERAADVMLKESKMLVLVPRESPYSEIHLENMLKLKRMGARIVDANPGFYHQPQSVQDMIDFVAARILGQLNIEQNLQAAWPQSSQIKK